MSWRAWVMIGWCVVAAGLNVATRLVDDAWELAVGWLVVGVVLVLVMAVAG